MKKIIYIAMMVGAFAISGCNKQTANEETENSKGTEISEEDRNWQYDYIPSTQNPTKSFICTYDRADGIFH